jgi:hypothetical protein
MTKSTEDTKTIVTVAEESEDTVNMQMIIEQTEQTDPIVQRIVVPSTIVNHIEGDFFWHSEKTQTLKKSIFRENPFNEEKEAEWKRLIEKWIRGGYRFARDEPSEEFIKTRVQHALEYLKKNADEVLTMGLLRLCVEAVTDSARAVNIKKRNTQQNHKQLFQVEDEAAKERLGIKGNFETRGRKRVWSGPEFRNAIEKTFSAYYKKHFRTPNLKKMAEALNARHPKKPPFKEDTLRKAMQRYGIDWKLIKKRNK